MESTDIEASEFVINTKPSQGRSRLVSIVSVGLAVSGVALLVSTTSGKAVSVQNESSVSALNVVDRRVTRSGNDFERNLASSPTKSPSSGLHKPTWKPSSKPVEHASKQSAALPRALVADGKPVVTANIVSDLHRLLEKKSSEKTKSTKEVSTKKATNPPPAPEATKETKVGHTKDASDGTTSTKDAARAEKAAELAAEKATKVAEKAEELAAKEKAAEKAAKKVADTAAEKAAKLAAKASKDPIHTKEEANEDAETKSTKVDKTMKKMAEVEEKPVYTKISAPVADSDKESKSSKSSKNSKDRRVLDTLSQFDVKAMKATASIDLDALDEKSPKKEAVVVVEAPIDAPVSVSPIVDSLKETATRSKQEKAEKLDEKLSMKNQIKKASSHDHRVLGSLSQFDVKAMKATASIDLDALDEKSPKKEAVVVVEAPIDAPVSVSPIVDSLKETATRSKQEKAEKLDEKLSMKNQIKKASSHDHRSLAGSPTKSPSSGLHKPTWKPSSKPAEHRRLKEVAATKTAPQVAAKALKAEIVDEKKTLTSLDKTEKAQVKVDINQNQKIVKDVKILGMRTDVTNTASQELLPPKALKKVVASGAVLDTPRSIEVTATKDTKTTTPTKEVKEESSKSKSMKEAKPEEKTVVSSSKADIKALKAELKDEKKVLKSLKEVEEDVNDNKKSILDSKIILHTEKDVVSLDTEFNEMEENRIDRKVAKKEKAEAEEALASARPSKDTTNVATEQRTSELPASDVPVDCPKTGCGTGPGAVVDANQTPTILPPKPLSATELLTRGHTKTKDDGKLADEEVVALVADQKTLPPPSQVVDAAKKPELVAPVIPSARKLAGSPTKSPSSGLHKPTWKPSSKPAEHRRLETRDERAEQHGTHVAKDGEDKDSVTYDMTYPSSSTSSKSSKEILTPPVKGSKLGQITEVKDSTTESTTESNKSSKTDTEDSSSSSSSKKTDVPAKIAKQIKTTNAAVKDLKKMLPIESKDEKLAFKADIKEVKADIKDEKKSLTKLDTKDEKKDVKKEIKSEVKSLAEIKLAYDAEGNTPASAWGAPVIHDKDAEDVALDTEFYEMEENRTDRKVAKKAKAEAEESLASARPSKDSRKLAGSPTKSPSSGLHKPTWKPSSKPNEHRELQKNDADPCHDGLSPRCTPPTSKPVEHRSLAGSPTKSPSSGLHKPTWKPSSKPAEH